jgi:hypothetical protein
MMARFFGENLDSFYQWIEFLVAKRILLGTCASLIAQMAFIDDQLITSSLRAFEVCIAVWTCEDDSGRYAVISKYGETCPILELIMAFLQHRVGRATFCAFLDVAPGRVENIAKTIRARVQQLVERFGEKDVQCIFGLKHLLALLDLTRAIPRGHRDWVVVCGTEDLLNVVTASLGAFSAAEESLDCWKLVLKALGRIHDLTFKPSLGTYPAFLKVAAIARGGALPLLIECALRFTSLADEYRNTSLIIQKLLAYAFYHEVSPTLLPETFDLTLRMEDLKKTPGPDGKKLWRLITTPLSHATGIHSCLSLSPRQFCDALNV